MASEAAAEPVRFRVYSDYLCPWCRNLDAVIERLRAEYGDRVSFEWSSYLLRPQKKEGRDLAKFRHYTKGWLRIGAQEGGAEFRLWSSDEGPPSHSVPPHTVAKAAARLGPEAFEAVHRRLMEAYFVHSRDITTEANLRDIWRDAGLPAEAFERSRDPALAEAVIAEHRAALEAGVTGVPAMQLIGNPAVIVGFHPIELYRRWIDKTLARCAAEPDAG